MYYISIYFDQKATNRLQDYINQVAKKSGNTFMSDQNVPPHITISAFASKMKKKSSKNWKKLFQIGSKALFSGYLSELSCHMLSILHQC